RGDNCREVAGSRWNTPAPQQNSVPLHNPVAATSVYKCWRNSFNADSHKRAGLSSPVFASSIILLAICWGCPAFLLNIEKRCLPRLMLSGDGLASKDTV